MAAMSSPSNGEIYNYLELRAELEALGEQFQSHSDTEVLLVAYKVWGERQCSALQGNVRLRALGRSGEEHLPCP